MKIWITQDWRFCKGKIRYGEFQIFSFAFGNGKSGVKWNLTYFNGSFNILGHSRFKKIEDNNENLECSRFSILPLQMKDWSKTNWLKFWSLQILINENLEYSRIRILLTKNSKGKIWAKMLTLKRWGQFGQNGTAALRCDIFLKKNIQKEKNVHACVNFLVFLLCRYQHRQKVYNVRFLWKMQI